MPVNRNIPYTWYDTPNIHFFTRRDFGDLCRRRNIEIRREVFLHRAREIPRFLPNLFATDVCCLLSERAGGI
ncbi:MAG: methionine biosynthesis protein MetW, partial [Spirochaetales bacterium]|nr:methionine biosynthesis protein MetW [Spirochaetales bacterium]